MTIETLVAKYGLLAILLGAGVEGEAVVVTGGVLAHRGLVPLIPACICAAVGSFRISLVRSERDANASLEKFRHRTTVLILL